MDWSFTTFRNKSEIPDNARLIEEEFSEDYQSDQEPLELPKKDSVRKEPQRWLGHHTSAVKTAMKARGGKALTADYLKANKDCNKHVR